MKANKEIMSRNIRFYMDRDHIDRGQLSKALDVPYTTLTDWINAKTYPRIDKIELMANYFGIEKADLVDEREKRTYPDILPVHTHKIPLVGKIACGTPIVANQEHEYIDVDDAIKADFAVMAKGDSMIGARILDGDTVFIREQPDVENGQIAAIGIGDEVTLKRVYKDKNMITLVAENPAYPPMIYQGPDLDDVRILGKAVSFNSTVQ